VLGCSYVPAQILFRSVGFSMSYLRCSQYFPPEPLAQLLSTSPSLARAAQMPDPTHWSRGQSTSQRQVSSGLRGLERDCHTPPWVPNLVWPFRGAATSLLVFCFAQTCACCPLGYCLKCRRRWELFHAFWGLCTGTGCVPMNGIGGCPSTSAFPQVPAIQTLPAEARAGAESVV